MKWIGKVYELYNNKFSLDNLVKNLAKDDFKYLSQEFGNNKLDLVK